MDEANGLKKEVKYLSAENLHSIIGPAGAAKVGCKKTERNQLPILKGLLNEAG